MTGGPIHILRHIVCLHAAVEGRGKEYLEKKRGGAGSVAQNSTCTLLAYVCVFVLTYKADV